MVKKTKKKTAKKPDIKTCADCQYGAEERPDPLTQTKRTRCRRYPNHVVFNSTHWCGEFKQ